MISSSLGWLCRQSGGESREKKFFEKVEKFSKSQNARRVRTIFFLCIERDTAPLRWQKNSKFFHRFWRFDSPALCLTKDWWVESEWPWGLFPKSPADRYLIDESVCESALSCDECKPVSGRLLTRGWFDSLSRFEWTRKTVDGTWNLKKKFFEKISKYKASALEDYAFT